jgi:hypothetical protein
LHSSSVSCKSELFDRHDDNTGNGKRSVSELKKLASQ